MCSSDDHVFFINRNQADYIRVLNSKFQAEGKIPTGLGKVQRCQIDISLIGEHQHPTHSTPGSAPSPVSTPVDHTQSGMHSPADFHRNANAPDNKTINHTIVISTSGLNPSLRAVNQTVGVVWQLNRSINPDLGFVFNPCSVSASEKGVIYFADHSAGKVGIFILILS